MNDVSATHQLHIYFVFSSIFDLDVLRQQLSNKNTNPNGKAVNQLICFTLIFIQNLLFIGVRD